MAAIAAEPARSTTRDWRGIAVQIAPFVAVFAAAMILPFVSNDYWALIGTRAAILDRLSECARAQPGIIAAAQSETAGSGW